MVKEGDVLWVPSEDWVSATNIHRFANWLKDNRGIRFDDYDQLWRWSVTDIEAFWQAIWDYFGVRASSPPERVLAARRMPGAQWFPGARLNYAEHVLRGERPGADALLFMSETAPLQGMKWEEFAGKVRVLATRLRQRGVKPRDRVVGYMPHIPETMLAMLATTSIGAIWACCSPDFGIRGVVDRLSQLAPKVLFCVDGYRYGDRDFDRRSELRQVIDHLPTLESILYLSYLDVANRTPPRADAVFLRDELDRPAVAAADFRFEQVPFDHPLWILFSSGTTGLPKPIVHGHGGILLEMLKSLHFHMDFRPGERIFFHTTTGWMMWNVVASSFLASACPVLYDGNPAHPTPDILWKIVQDSGARFFGASPSYVEVMISAGIVPGRHYDMSSLRAIMPAGSPVSPECTAWFYEKVKKDLWIATGSGGTDVCTGLVGGVPTLPVRAGEIQARCLGVAARAFNGRGESVVGETGELVITEPMPSMPLFFWNDPDGTRQRESYFADFPGVWRHGDFFRVNERGGCFVLGRSDATLNRHGIRIGTAEIYRTLSLIEEVDDSLIVNLDLPGGRFFMPLFVKLRSGLTLDRAIEDKIRATLRKEYSPRHVPDRILQVDAIPSTLSGKKMEVPVRKILLGFSPEKVANRDTMRDPAALDYFVTYARTQRDYPLNQLRHARGKEMADKPKVLMIITLDTKDVEAAYVRRCLEEQGMEVYHLDASIRRTVEGGAAITPDQIATAAGTTMDAIRALRHEGKCQAVMIKGAVKCAHELDKRVGLSGIIGAGGSMGTALGTAVMRTFSFGLPKVMISTMASGMTKTFVGTKDIVMVNSVADISGLNSITRTVFRNGALALAGMAREYQGACDRDAEKPLVAMTTLGTTEKCSARVRKGLEDSGFEVVVFHTLGTGGATMDEIVREREVAAVVDLSLVEVSEHLHNGLCSAGPDRCKAALEKGVPTIFAPGNIDFLIAGPMEDAVVRFPGKRYHVHNSLLTAARAGAEEFQKDAEYLAGLVRGAKGLVVFMVPLLGFSNHDSEDGHLHDPSLPPVFADHLKKMMPDGVPVVEMPFHINDTQFADAIIAQVRAMVRPAAA